MPVTGAKQIIVSTASGTAISTVTSWIPLDIHSTPFNVGFGCIVHGNGNITYRVEHTFDNPFTVSSCRTFIHEDVSAESASKDGNYAFGVRAIRLAVVSASSSAGVSLNVVQVGI